MVNSISDKEIIRGVTEGDQIILKYLYKTLRPKVIAKIKKIGGSREDGRDIFQVVLLKIFSVLQEKQVEINDFSNYFISAGVYEYYSSFAQTEKIPFEQALFENMADDSYYDYDGMVRFINAFNQLGEDCKRLLRLRSDKVSYDEIAEIMGYSSIGYAQNKRERCLKYFHKIYRNKD